MKKSTSSTPKEILKRRVANNRLLKLPGEKHYVCREKEIELLKIKNYYTKTKFFKARDRDLKDDPYRNPYALPERLRVTTKSLPPRKPKKTPFIMDEPHTVCDIDPMFYKIIEGRPIRSFYDIKQFMRHLRNILLFRADCAYLNDENIQIESRMLFEKEEYDAIYKAVDNIEAVFVIFAAESYKDAKYMQKLAEEKAEQLAVITEDLEAISFKFHKLKNKVSTTVGIYENLSRYKKFLNCLAPDWWRERYEEICELGDKLCTDFFCTLESEAIESVADVKKSALTLAGLQAQLYFKRPMELMVILECMGRQCLNYMEIVTYFATYIASVNKYKKDYTKRLNAECTDVQEIIEHLTEKIRFAEERKNECKAAFHKLLDTEFHRLFASYESTKLFTCLQYVHTRIFGVMEDPKDTLTSLTEDLERWYFELSTRMDNLNLQVVKVATRQIFDEDIHVMRKASNAERQLKEYQVLCKALYKSFEPSRRKTRN